MSISVMFRCSFIHNTNAVIQMDSPRLNVLRYMYIANRAEFAVLRVSKLVMNFVDVHSRRTQTNGFSVEM